MIARDLRQNDGKRTFLGFDKMMLIMKPRLFRQGSHDRGGAMRGIRARTMNSENDPKTFETRY
jgi:hypothetical protein